MLQGKSWVSGLAVALCISQWTFSQTVQPSSFNSSLNFKELDSSPWKNADPSPSDRLASLSTNRLQRDSSPLASSSSSTGPQDENVSLDERVSRGEYSNQDTPSYLSQSSLFDELTFLVAIDGSKQPQDFGVNAHAGGQASMNWGIPLNREHGIGFQFGTGITSTANAVRVFELLGESTGRTQSFTTLGLFQRTEFGVAWGFVYDFLHEEYFDDFMLGQWRVRGSYDLTCRDQVGMTAALRSQSDQGVFGIGTPVTLQPITQGSLFYRHYWATRAQTTLWLGLADRHGENNAVTGPSPSKKGTFLFGADVLMPLSSSLAIYGETNMITPTDTGTVDAFLGVQWYPKRKAFVARKGLYSPLLPLASPTTFSVDLLQ